MLEVRRWGIFWRVRCEKRWRRVWRLEILSIMEEMSRSTLLIFEVKKVVTNGVEPMGCPRRRKPEVSSTGTAGSNLSVGLGVVEKKAIVLAKEDARVGLWADRRGRMEELSQEVRMRVFDGWMKQPIEARRDLSCLHRNSKSGR